MWSIVVIGRTATASGAFLLDDVPGTSGRLDVLIRCVRASLLVSHGVRRDVVLYLVLGGGSGEPCTVRLSGADAQFLRPDERSLAVLMKKTLGARSGDASTSFVKVRSGLAISPRGLDGVFFELPNESQFVLDENAPDIRSCEAFAQCARAGTGAFFVGDHLGIEDDVRRRLEGQGARAVALGPTSLHAEDAIAVALNEVDRARASSLASK